MLILDVSSRQGGRHMAKAYDRDLRVRVVAAIEAGATGEAAAERFEIGKSTAGAWARLKRRTGDVTPGRQGQPSRSKLDPHADFILALLEAEADITLAEIAARLEAEHGMRAALATVWGFLNRRGITFKKRLGMPASRVGRTSPRPAKSGKRPSPHSIPNA
jgi:transposase